MRLQAWYETAPNGEAQARSKDVCQFCGAPAHAWHGNIVWCGSARCDVLHDWATHEPRLLLPPAMPLLWGRLGCWLMYAAYRLASAAIPIWWAIRPEYAGWRQTVAVWAHGGESFWWNRRRGLE